MKVLKFLWYLIVDIILYSISVLPAAWRDAWHETFRRNDYRQRDQQVRFEGPGSDHHHRRRRGHRGGKKHRKHFH